MRIAICDDEKIHADIIYECLTKFSKSKNIDAVIKKYTEPKKLLEDYHSIPFDIMFLDIDMPMLTGFDISKIVRKSNIPTYLVYVSAKQELVYNSFEYNPFYFICKKELNLLEKDLAHVMEKLLIHYQQHRKIKINDTSNGQTFVTMRDIIYIKSNKHYLEYYVSNRLEPYYERGTINNKDLDISSPDFLKIHQRYLVNMRHIEKFNGMINVINTSNGDTLPISKSLKIQAQQAYLKYKRR